MTGMDEEQVIPEAVISARVIVGNNEINTVLFQLATNRVDPVTRARLEEEVQYRVVAFQIDHLAELIAEVGRARPDFFSMIVKASIPEEEIKQARTILDTHLPRPN